MGANAFTGVQAAEIFAVLWLVIMSVSHVLQPKAWAAFFIRLREMGNAGVFANGFLTLIFGSLIAAFHDVWTWPGIAVTLIGWSQVVKGAVAFIAPDISAAGMRLVSLEKAWRFQAAGAVMLIATIWLGYLLYASWKGIIP